MSPTILTDSAITELERRYSETARNLRWAHAEREAMRAYPAVEECCAKNVERRIARLEGELAAIETHLHEVNQTDDWLEFQREWTREAAARGEPDDLPF